MREVVSNTSPLQYLHQLGLLDIMPALYDEVLISYAVVKEIEAGRFRGVPLPVLESLPWIRAQNVANAALLPLLPDLGAGETAALTSSNRCWTVSKIFIFGWTRRLVPMS